MFTRPAGIVGALLVGFHGWLLAGHAWTGQLADPGLALRWLSAAGLLAAILVLRRQGQSVAWGRRAVALWLLAAVLHAPALADRVEHTSPALPEAVVTLVGGAASVSLGALLGLALARALWRVGRSTTRRLRAGAFVLVRRLSCPAVLHRLSPRPPPDFASVPS